MLGENHSLTHEFPEYIDKIKELLQSDVKFSEKMKVYDAIDEEIRSLELRDSPIGDDIMREKKHIRSVLKDELYRLLIKA
ncbi:YdcH family protein [Agarilytica rhodophyticola]|uniref:YdcH family protein n=1 Tax=Agarilytica rhodophyticola TaxID=1737490 RepID=UPI000B3494BF|nr:YdcH family protein [Agarilytica rhodophyticola]